MTFSSGWVLNASDRPGYSGRARYRKTNCRGHDIPYDANRVSKKTLHPRLKIDGSSKLSLDVPLRHDNAKPPAQYLPEAHCDVEITVLFMWGRGITVHFSRDSLTTAS